MSVEFNGLHGIISQNTSLFKVLFLFLSCNLGVARGSVDGVTSGKVSGSIPDEVTGFFD
jgi:hypothetical protein